MRCQHNLPAGRSISSDFTLIELLVVVAIVGVLMAMLLPGLGAARERGRRAACLSNTRQLAAAGLIYAGDASNFVPGCSVEGWGPGGWNKDYVPANLAAPQVLWDQGYLRARELMRCPSRVDRPCLGNPSEGLAYVRNQEWNIFRSCYAWVGSSAPPVRVNNPYWEWGVYWTRLDRLDRADYPLVLDLASDELRPNGGWIWMRKSSHFNVGTGMPDGGNVANVDGSARWLPVNPLAPPTSQKEWSIGWQYAFFPLGTSQPQRMSSYYFTTLGDAPAGPRRGRYYPPP